MGKKIKGWVENNEWLLITLMIVMVLRIPNLFEPAWYGDEGIYLAVGQGIRKGLGLYKEIFDHKPPVIYWLAAAAGRVMWFKLMGIVANLMTIVLISKIAKKLFDKQRVRESVVLMFGVLSALPWLEGNIMNAELLFILFTSLAMWLLLKKRMMNLKWSDFLLVGLSLGLGLLIKAPVLLDLGAVIIWLLAFRRGLKIYWQYIGKAVMVMVGALLPTILSGIYFWYKNSLDEFIQAAWRQNFSYLSSWGGEGIGSGSIGESGLVIRGLFLLAWLAISWWWTRKETVKLRLIVVWFGMSLFGSLLAGRPYPHYLLQLVPAAVLLIGVVWETKKKGTVLSASLGGMLLLSAAFRYDFAFYPAGEYYTNFAKYVMGQKGQAEFYDDFDWRTTRNYQIGRFIKERTSEDERIYVWGDEPYIYVLADRLPVGKWVMAYHVDIFDNKDKLMKEFELNPPKFLLWAKEDASFQRLADFRDERYLLVKEFDQIKVYRRIDWRQ